MSKLSDIMVKDGHLGGYIPGGDPGTFCPNLWRWAIKQFRVRSLLDVGCGEGHSARFFQDQGCNVLGIEGCWKAVKNTAIPGNVAHHDFTEGPLHLARNYDLVWSCEFLEHVEHRFVPHILSAFANAGKAIMVTHAFPRQTDGYHHVNCRPSSYWIRLIEGLGFQCSVRLSREARAQALKDYPGINHFARSGLVFVRTNQRPPAGIWASFQSALGPTFKSWKINWGFRWSHAYRQQRRRRRLAKKAAQAR
jgi:SAM-dependent methyltransferase